MIKLNTVTISGKEYVPVNKRIKYFREHHAGYSLRSDLILVDGTQALIKAIIRDENDRIIAEGTAYEKADSSFINKDSHVENAETSAWGRALGNLGIGIDVSVATADEVANAVLNQKFLPQNSKKTDMASPEDIEEIKTLCKETGTDIRKLYEFYKIKGTPTPQQATSMIAALKKKLSAQLDSSAPPPPSYSDF